MDRDAPFHEVAPRLFVGHHPARGGRLAQALAELRHAGIGAVVSVCEEGLDASVLQRAGLLGLHLLVSDYDAPEPSQLERAVDFTRAAHARGEGVLVHCFAGIGRSATVACAVLIADGMPPTRAIAQLRARRHPMCVESTAQQEALREWGERFGFR